MKSTYILPIAAAAAVLGMTGSSAAPVRASLLGQEAAEESAAYAIVIRPDTRYVNVTSGDTVKFISGDKNFTWTFNGARSISSFDLDAVAPQGWFDHRVTAYLAPNAKDYGG